MTFKSWMCAAGMAVAMAGSPAQAGSCPKGQVEVCPLYDLGEQGPCECRTPQRIRGTPQTLVNNTGAAPEPQGPPKLGAAPAAPLPAPAKP